MSDDRLANCRKELEDAAGILRELCEPVAPPMRTREYLTYFCARDLSNDNAVAANEFRRLAFYDAVDAYARAYFSIENELAEAGYAAQEIAGIEKEVALFQQLRGEIGQAAGDGG